MGGIGEEESGHIYVFIYLYPFLVSVSKTNDFTCAFFWHIVGGEGGETKAECNRNIEIRLFTHSGENNNA